MGPTTDLSKPFRRSLQTLRSPPLRRWRKHDACLVCIYIYISTYMCMCICVYIYIHIYIYVYVCVCKYTHMFGDPVLGLTVVDPGKRPWRRPNSGDAPGRYEGASAAPGTVWSPGLGASDSSAFLRTKGTPHWGHTSHLILATYCIIYIYIWPYAISDCKPSMVYGP